MDLNREILYLQRTSDAQAPPRPVQKIFLTFLPKEFKALDGSLSMPLAQQSVRKHVRLFGALEKAGGGEPPAFE